MNQQSINSTEILMPIKDKRQLKNHVHVSVRLKPTPSFDRKKIWKTINQNSLKQTLNDEVFTFDRIYEENINTEDIFKD